MNRRVLAIVATGLLGVALAAGLALAADRITSQSVGLADEPLTAGDALAPAPARTHRPRRRPATPKKAAPPAPVRPGTPRAVSPPRADDSAEAEPDEREREPDEDD